MYDFVVATSHSFGLLCAFRRDSVERAAIAFEDSLLPAQGLPALHHHVGELRVELNAVTHTLRKLAAASVVLLPRKGS